MTPTDTFMELNHDTCALFTAHTGQDRVSVAMPEQFSIHQGVFACILLDDFGLRRLLRE